MKNFAIMMLFAAACGVDAPDGQVTSALTNDTQYCAYEDGVWSCGESGGGGGGGGGGGDTGEDHCMALCDVDIGQAAADAACRSSCGSKATCGLTGICLGF